MAAGISKKWVLNNMLRQPSNDRALNEKFDWDPEDFSFNSCAGSNRSRTGDNITQSPLWIRQHSLAAEAIEVNQVVGHTHQIEINIQDFQTHKIAFIDCLDNISQYLEIENGEASIKKL